MAVPPIPIPMRGPPAGGGGPMPPQGGPPMGGMIAQVLQQLMSNPAAIKGMQNFMSGQPPTAGMPVPGAATAAMTRSADPNSGQAGPMPPMPSGAPGPGGGPPPDAAEQMASDQIDKAGSTWDGVDAPTKNDIQRLLEDPSPTAIKSFDEQFGQGMAEKYIGDSEGEEGTDSSSADESDQGEGEPQRPPQGYKR